MGRHENKVDAARQCRYNARRLSRFNPAPDNALREPGRIPKALLPPGVDRSDTALAQSFCAEKYRILLLLAESFSTISLVGVAFSCARELLAAAALFPFERN